MSRFVYKGNKTKEISFPLGGIGTGCIGLAGNGRLIDWEIYNRPNKGRTNGFSHFAIKAEAKGKVIDARVLNSDLLPPYSGTASKEMFGGSGFGPPRDYMSGIPHFRDSEFHGEFPLATLKFRENKFPGQVSLHAFNPFIPLNDKDSGIPAAFFQIEVKNPTRRPIDYTICGTLGNPLPANNIHRVFKSGNVRLLHLTSNAFKKKDVKYGDMTLATDGRKTSHQTHWFKLTWFDTLEVYWREFIAPGRFKERRYPSDKDNQGSHGVLAVHLRVQPGQTGRARFVITWNFPNCETYWAPDTGKRARKAGISATWKNYYATMFKDSAASACYSLKNWDRLYQETRLFKDALFASDLPEVALESVSANLSVLKSPTVMRLQDGTFYGFEGCHASEGCCEGSCTHVWNYAQALPFLFPKLERSMRSADYKYNQRPDGGMEFRIQLPLGIGQNNFRPCGDGHFGGVLKAFRDWKVSGDTKWLKSIWPAIKKSMSFAWNKANPDKWDPDKTGVLQGRQHHTLDVELFGPNAWLTGFYLAALKAATLMADHLGESKIAREYRAIFTRGKRWADKHLFNGEYYHQIINLKDKALLKKYDAVEQYWNDEHKEIKYQIGQGCELDQVLAQWHANLYGLGEIFDPKQTKKALKSIYKYNFKTSFRDFYNPCRIYALNDESGLAICDWPKHKYKPMIPLPYAQETQNGYEYAACIQMIQTGLIKEGMNAVKAIRDRYDGEKRNPWNEFECGNNYARSMASFSIVPTFSGFKFDLVNNLIGFNPIQPKRGQFRCFWSLDPGWGMFEMKPGRAEIKVLYGQLVVQILDLGFLRGRKVKQVSLGSKTIEFTQSKGRVELTKPIMIVPGRKLSVAISS